MRRFFSALYTLQLKGKSADDPLHRAFYVRFYESKVKDKQEKQVKHTYNLTVCYLDDPNSLPIFVITPNTLLISLSFVAYVNFTHIFFLYYVKLK